MRTARVTDTQWVMDEAMIALRTAQATALMTTVARRWIGINIALHLRSSVTEPLHL